MNPKEEIIFLAILVYLLAPITAILFMSEIANSTTTTANAIGGIVLVSSAQKASFSWGYLVYTVIALIATAIAFIYLKITVTFRTVLNYYVPAALMIATFYLVYIWSSAVIPNFALGVTIMAMLIMLAIYRFRRMKYFNLFGMVMAIGFAGILGFMLNPEVGMILLGIIAVYDIIAVFITKHMLTMARMITEGTPLPLMIITGNVKTIEDKFDGNAKLSDKEPKASGLGLGDLILPATIPVAYIITNPTTTLWIKPVIGAIVGVVLNMLVLNYYKKPLPAIPLIFISMLFFVLV